MEHKAPAYQEYARDIYMKCASLTLEQRGAVRTLRDYQWIEGPLVDDPVQLAQVLGVPVKQFKEIWPAIERFFPPSRPGYLADPELEAKRKDDEEYRRQAQESGRRGAEARWGKQKGGDRAPHSPPQSTPDKGNDGSAPASASAGTTSATTRMREKLTLEAQEAFDGMIRSVRVPYSLVAECEALVNGMRNVNPVPTWEAVSLALVDLRATGEAFTHRRLRAFVNDAMRHLAEGLSSRNGARGPRGRESGKPPQTFQYEPTEKKPHLGPR